MSRAEINKRHLIFGMMDDERKIGSKLSQLSRIELTEEDGELGVVTAAFQVIEHLPAPFVVGDVVADEIVPTGGHGIVTA
jgi:hypothetical protein